MHLHAVLEGGEPALVVDNRLPPYFYVRSADGEALRRAALWDEYNEYKRIIARD